MAINYLENTESWSYVWVSFIGLSCCVVKDAMQMKQKNYSEIISEDPPVAPEHYINEWYNGCVCR